MNYNTDGFEHSIEGLLLDYLIDRKTSKKRGDEMQDDYKPGKGWPEYKNSNVIFQGSERLEEDEQYGASLNIEQTKRQDEKTPYDYKMFTPVVLEMESYQKTDKQVQVYDKPEEDLTGLYEKDLKYRGELYSEISKKMSPYVEQVLDELEYEDSPLYKNNEMTKEVIAGVADKVLEWSANDIEQVEEIILDANTCAGHNWSRPFLLKTVIEALILHDIFSVRRPRYRIYKNGFTL